MTAATVIVGTTKNSSTVMFLGSLKPERRKTRRLQSLIRREKGPIGDTGGEKHVINLQLQYEKETHEHQLLQEKYAVLEEDSKYHFEDMKANYESAIAEKDKQIVFRRKTIEEYNQRLCTLISKGSNSGVPCNSLKKQSSRNDSAR